MVWDLKQNESKPNTSPLYQRASGEWEVVDSQSPGTPCVLGHNKRVHSLMLWEQRKKRDRPVKGKLKES